MECLICFENIKKNYIVLQCGHRFHQKCIQQWEYHLISRNQVLTCPCCRKEYDNVAYNIRNNIRYKNKELVEKICDKIIEIDEAPIFINNRTNYNEKIEKFFDLFTIINRNQSYLKYFTAFISVLTDKIIDFKNEIEGLRNITNKNKKKIIGLMNKTIKIFSH